MQTIGKFGGVLHSSWEGSCTAPKSPVIDLEPLVCIPLVVRSVDAVMPNTSKTPTLNIKE